MDTSFWSKLKSILGMIVLPTVCLALFFIAGYQIDQIIRDADAAGATEGHESAATVESPSNMSDDEQVTHTIHHQTAHRQ
jgi:hypothetical protein